MNPMRPSTHVACMCMCLVITTNLAGVSASTSASRIYITDADSGGSGSTSKIWKMKLDGSSSEAVMTDSAGDYQDPTGIGINEKTKKLYFAADKKIFMSDLDGGNIEEFRQNEGYEDITSIVIDAAADYLYLSDVGTQKIQKCKLSETYGTEPIVEFSNIKPYDIALDTAGSTKRIYWSDNREAIYRVDVDGTNKLKVANAKSGANFRGISLSPHEDSGKGFVYYTDGTKVRRSSMDSTSYPDTAWTEVLDASGQMSSLYDLEVDPDDKTASAALILIGDGKVATTTIGASPAAASVISTLASSTVKGLLLYNPLAAVTTTFTAPGNSAEAVAPAAFSLVEGGVTVSYSVVLDRPPTSSVDVTLGTDDALSTDATTLTFTPANWDTAQNVAVTATANNNVDGEHTSAVTSTCTSNDSAFEGLSVPDVTVSINDNQLEKLFWTDKGDDTINRANLAGNGMEVLVSTDSPYPLGVSVEILQQKVYWVDKGINSVRPRVKEALIDGNARDDSLVDLGNPGMAAPTDVVASSSVGGLGRVFWLDTYSTTPALRSADLDGANVANLLQGSGDGLSRPYSLILDEHHVKNTDGVTYDLDEARLYWLDEVLKEISYVKAKCADTNSCAKTVLKSLAGNAGISQPKGMCLDTVGRRIYFVDKSTKKVHSIDLPTDGSFPTMVETVLSGSASGNVKDPIACAVNHLTNTLYMLDIRPPGAILKATIDSTGKTGKDTTSVLSGTGTAAHGLAVFVDLPGVTLSAHEDNSGTVLHAVTGSRHETVGEKRTWKAGMTVGEGSTDAAGANYNVVLDMQPLQAVTIDISAVHKDPCVFNKAAAAPGTICDMNRPGGNAVGQVGLADYANDAVEFSANGDQSTLTLDPPRLIFTTANWRTPQKVNVKADDDDIAQGVRVVQLLHKVTSGDAKYTDPNMAELDVTVVEDDRYGITSSKGQIAMLEHRSADFDMKLDSQPYSDVTVQVGSYHHNYPKSGMPEMSGDHSQLNFTPGVLTFTPTNWASAQTVTVQAVNDNIAQGFRRPTVQFRSKSGDARYHRLPNAFSSVVANVTEDDVAKITLNRLQVDATEHAGCRRAQTGCDFHTANCGKEDLLPSTATNLVMPGKLINADYPVPAFDPNQTAINRTYCPGGKPAAVWNGRPNTGTICGAHRHAGGKCVWSGVAMKKWYNESAKPAAAAFVEGDGISIPHHWVTREFCGDHQLTASPTHTPTESPSPAPTATPTTGPTTTPTAAAAAAGGGGGGSSRRRLLATDLHLAPAGTNPGDTTGTIFDDPGAQVDADGHLACEPVCECSGTNPTNGEPWLNTHGAGCAYTKSDWDVAANCDEYEGVRAEQSKLGLYTVKLETVPYHTVTVEIVASDPSQVFVQPSMLIFRGSDDASYSYTAWEYDDTSEVRAPLQLGGLTAGEAGILEQQVYVFAQDDYVAERIMNVTLTMNVLSDDVSRDDPTFTTDPASDSPNGDSAAWRCVDALCTTVGHATGGYNDIGSDNVTVTVMDNDVAAVVSSNEEVAVVENSVTNFSMSLATRPAHGCDTECVPGAVTVNVKRFVDPQDHSMLTVSPETLVFTSTDWHLPQQVFVRATDDEVVQGVRSSTLYYTAASSDEFFDRANSFHALAALRSEFPDGSVWAQGGYEAIHEANLNEFGTSCPVVTIKTEEDDVPSVVMSEVGVGVEECEDRFNLGLQSFEAGLSVCSAHMLDNFTVKLGTRPYNPVTVTLVVGNDVACAGSGYLFGGAYCTDTMVQLKVVPSELIFGGAMDCKRGAGCTDKTTNFTGDWEVEQSVMVIAAENVLDDGERIVNVTGLVSSNDTCLPHVGCKKSVYERHHAYLKNETSGEVLVDEMRGVVVPTLESTIQDNEKAAVSIAPFDKPLAKGQYHSAPVDIDVALVEGQSTKYNVKLSVRPNYEVTVVPRVSDEYQLSVKPELLIFGPSDYYLDKHFTVTARANYVHDFDRNQSVRHEVRSNETGLAECTTASKQGNGVWYTDEEAPCKTKYNGTLVGVVYLHISDDDQSGVGVQMPAASADGLISGGGLQGVMVEGSSLSYNVVLDSEPIEPVEIDLEARLLSTGSSTIALDTGDAVEDAGLQLMMLPKKLSFTAKTWNKPQRVVVVARDNGVFEGFDGRQVNISHASSSADPNYQKITISEIAVNITDDDAGCHLDAQIADPVDPSGANSQTATRSDLDRQSQQYSCDAYMTAEERAKNLEATKDRSVAVAEQLTHCSGVTPRKTSAGIFGRPNRPPPNSVFLRAVDPLLELQKSGKLSSASDAVSSSDKIAQAALTAHLFAASYLSGGVCKCALGRGGNYCQFESTKYQRLELTIESPSGFDVSYTNGRSWTALALSLGVEEPDVYIVEVRPSYCLFSFKMFCVEVVVDLSGDAYELDVMKMVQTDAPNVRDLHVKDIHAVSNYPGGGLLVGATVYPLSSVSALFFMAWLTCSCYYGWKKGKAEREKVAAIRKDKHSKDRKEREDLLNEDEESKEEER